MEETKRITIDGYEYDIATKRFDEEYDNHHSYHGVYITFTGPGVHVKGRKYDKDDFVNLEEGVAVTDMQIIETVRELARQTFGVTKLMMSVPEAPPNDFIKSPREV